MATTTDIPGIGSNLTQVSVSLEVPSLNPTTLDGGTGGISFGARDLTRPQLLRNSRVTLTDDSAGSFIGRISQVSWNPETSFTAETMLNRCTATVTVRPTQAAMSAGMNTVLGLVGMSATGLAATSITFPGWYGPLFDYLKLFCAVFDYEMIPHESNPDIVVFRAIRANELSKYAESVEFDVTDQDLARSIEVIDYGYTAMNNATNVEFSPAYSPDAPIITVEAGETVEQEIPVNGWVTSVNQPTVLDFVGPEERTDTGAYCVAGSDGLPITAAQWTGTGGSVRVELTDDPGVLKVIVSAPNKVSLKGTDGKDRFAPYSIAATALDNNLYNSLHITGTGVRSAPTTITIPTGVVEATTKEGVGATVDNPWITGPDRTFRQGCRAAQAYAGPAYSVSQTLASRSDLRNILGARVNGDLVKFRVNTATATERDETTSGTMDTTFGDFNTSASGMTFATWNAANAGMTFKQWAVVPLKTS